MKPMVVHVRASNFLGGPERQLLGHAWAARDAWYEIVLASFLERRSEVDFLEAARGLGARVLPLESSGPFDPAPLAALAQFAQRRPVAMFVAHGYKSAAVCEIVSRMVGRPWLGAARGFTGEDRKVRSFETLEFQLLKDARRVIAVSQGTAEMLAARGIPPERIRTVPNAVDVEYWSTSPRRPGDYWVYSGRLSPEKDLSTALKAISLRPSGARLVVAGDGPLRAQLELEAEHLGVAHRVDFLGFRGDMRDLYAGALGLCLPSRREGLPNAVLEALAAGLPVVATRVGGVPEIVEEGSTGYLVEPGDVEGLSRAMYRVESDRAGAERLGLAGREWVRSHFGFGRQRELWDGLLSEVVREEPRVAVPVRDRLKAGLKERLGATLAPDTRNPVILTFHRVVDLDDPLEVSATCPWISLRTFQALLDGLTREYEVVSLSDVLRSPYRGRTRVCITFDDGWRDNLTLASPALAARDLPWTVFAVTGWAGTSTRSWQDRLWEGALELYRSGEALPRVWRGIWPPEPARSRAELAVQCQAVVARLKRWVEARREEMLGSLPALSGGDAASPSRYLSADELAELSKAGVSVGSHSHTHALLGQVEDEDARRELAQSREILRQWLGTAPDILAYPNGSATPRTAALARDEGYRAAVTTREGRVESDGDLFLLPRVDMTEERLMGADGRFSYARFRFELSRVR